MKTLKKTLCLVLAVVLALGVMVLPAYADKERYDSFEDKTDVSLKHEEAVGTLTGLGVINGKKDKDGKYLLDPKTTINRAEAVTMIVRSLLNKAESSLPKENTKFTDVPKTHYASQYVAYAVEKGIVAGKSSTKFEPNDQVTGYELAKMALIAAGIKAPSDFNKSNWQTVSGSEARLAGLLVGLENITNLNTPLTREQSAQMIWNMITYVPEEITLEAVRVDDGGDGETYKVVYPEESIGGKIYNLEAVYNVQSPMEFGSYENDYGEPSVKWYNGKTSGKTQEVYYEGRCRGIVEFGAAVEKLTVGDIKAALGVSSGFSAFVYYNGWTASPKMTVEASTPDNTEVTTADRDRGATVTVFSAPWGDVKYWVYVNYTYVAYNADATAAPAETSYATKDNTAGFLKNGSSSTALKLGKVGAKSITIFGVSRYSKGANKNEEVYSAVNPITGKASKTAVQITSRNSNSLDPYFRIDGQKTYISAKAIYVSKDGDIQRLQFTYTNDKNEKNYINVDESRYYNVWFDKYNNVIALVETDPTPTPIGEYDLGYVLEFSCRKSVDINDGMTYGQNSAAVAKVLMVNLETGVVNQLDLAIKSEKASNGVIHSYVLNFDGTKGVEITGTITGAIEADTAVSGEAKQTEILHGFVAWHQLSNGYGVTEIEDVNTATSTTSKYMVLSSFTTSAAYKGKINVSLVGGGTDVRYADADSEITLLNTPTVAEDATRVASYKVEPKKGHAAFNNIVTNNDNDEILDGTQNLADPYKVHIGVNALFMYDTTTNMVKKAYVFGHEVTAVTYDYYVLVGRGEEVLGEGTVFTLAHNGVEADYPCDNVAVADMFIDRDDALDALDRHPVVFVTMVGGKIVDMQEVTDTTKYTSGTAFAYTTSAPAYVALQGQNPLYLTDGCWIYDAENEEIGTKVDVGDKVTVYYAGPSNNKIALIVITENA